MDAMQAFMSYAFQLVINARREVSNFLRIRSQQTGQLSDLFSAANPKLNLRSCLFIAGPLYGSSHGGYCAYSGFGIVVIVTFLGTFLAGGKCAPIFGLGLNPDIS